MPLFYPNPRHARLFPQQPRQIAKLTPNDHLLAFKSTAMTTSQATATVSTDDQDLELLHNRQLDLRFYKRKDGLYEVVGHLTDTKTYPFRLQLAPEDLPAGKPVHDMELRLVLDDDLTVHDVKAIMNATPFGVCLEAQSTLAPLKGLQIAAGWNKKVRELLGGAASCTHLMELLGPMATTAMQGLAPKRIEEIERPENEHLRQAKVNSCYAYGESRPVIARLWPHLSKPKA